MANNIAVLNSGIKITDEFALDVSKSNAYITFTKTTGDIVNIAASRSNGNMRSIIEEIIRETEGRSDIVIYFSNMFIPKPTVIKDVCIVGLTVNEKLKNICESGLIHNICESGLIYNKGVQKLIAWDLLYKNYLILFSNGNTVSIEATSVSSNRRANDIKIVNEECGNINNLFASTKPIVQTTTIHKPDPKQLVAHNNKSNRVSFKEKYGKYYKGMRHG